MYIFTASLRLYHAGTRLTSRGNLSYVFWLSVEVAERLVLRLSRPLCVCVYRCYGATHGAAIQGRFVRLVHRTPLAVCRGNSTAPLRAGTRAQKALRSRQGGFFLERVECISHLATRQRTSVATSLVSSVVVSPFLALCAFRSEYTHRSPAAPSIERTPRVDPPRVAQSSLSRRFIMYRRKSLPPFLSLRQSHVGSKVAGAHTRHSEPRPATTHERGRGDIDTRTEVTTAGRQSQEQAQTQRSLMIGNGKSGQSTDPKVASRAHMQADNTRKGKEAV